MSNETQDRTDLEKVADAVRAVAEAFTASRTSFVWYSRILLAVLLVITGVLGWMIRSVGQTTERVDTLVETVAQLSAETREAKEATADAAEQVQAAAAAQPRLEVVQAAPSASGKPPGPPRAFLVVPAKAATPKTDTKAAAPAAPAASIPISVSSALPVTTTTGGGP